MEQLSLRVGGSGKRQQSQVAYEPNSGSRSHSHERLWALPPGSRFASPTYLFVAREFDRGQLQPSCRLSNFQTDDPLIVTHIAIPRRVPQGDIVETLVVVRIAISFQKRTRAFTS
jgi:hypothetical protein